MKPFFSILLTIALLATALPAVVAAPTFDCAGVSEIPQTECEALVALYSSTSGENWTDHTNWLVSNTPSNWYGIEIIDGKTISVNLSNNHLVGNIPPELGNLPSLQYLSLSRNQLTGVIPQELSNSPSLLYLYLGENRLTGNIPTEIGNLHTLKILSLNANEFTGSIPPEIGNLTSLEFLDLSGNFFLLGTIPPEIGNLSALQYLSLYSCGLTGTIPKELGNLSLLRQLYLGAGEHLPNLVLMWNNLSGSIPAELGNLTSLEILALGHNQFTGSIPPEISHLSALKGLYISGNKLSGNIPAELGQLSNLEQLDLRRNQLSGSIPSELGDLTHLQKLELDVNRLTGNIPTQLGNLNSLMLLNLSQNQLSGNLQSELGNLTQLQRLDLDQNQFSGDIPASLVNLVNLANPGEFYGIYDGLDLDYNRLNVPSGYPDSSNPLQSFLSQKDPDWHLYQSVDSTIGTSGGEIVSLDGTTMLSIPEDTLPDETLVTFVPQAAPLNDGGNLAFANHDFQIFAHDNLGNLITSFSQAINVTIKYSDEEVIGISEDSLRLFYWNTDQEEWLDAVTTCPNGEYIRDLEANTLSLPLCHLSDFSLAVQKLYTFLPFVVR